MPETGWAPRFVCPSCAGDLTRTPSGVLGCPACNAAVPHRDGVECFLRTERLREIGPLIDQYRHIRESDGYRRHDAEYYCSLPSVARSDPEASTWNIRQESFANLCRHAMGRFAGDALRIVDLGAGSGWLSYRLAALGHDCVAVDWMADAEDGLGAARHYPVVFTCVQADFDELPLAKEQFDLAIFNASLHYSPDPASTLQRARQLLVPGGTLVVMDSPMFATDQDGRRMLAARDAAWAARNLPTTPIGAGYLTRGGLARAAAAAGVGLRWIPSRGKPGWAVRRWLAGLRQRRRPAAFGVSFGAWRPTSG